ncbi:MAG TPA: hypothetical protein VE985_01255 [Gaiellaceae bacterium]|nr:hypothetical protein [Gaiellaceae bacterium]
MSPHDLPPFTTATLAGHLPLSPAAIDATPAVGKDSPLDALAARSERDGQKNLPT